MLPIYLVIGLLQIFAKHYNYDIKKEDLEMDIRVRRNVNGYEKQNLQIPYVTENRYSAYPGNIPRYNYTNNNNTNHGNFFNNTWNYLFNKTKRYFNGNSVNNGTRSTTGSGYRNNAYIRSYPYGYPTGYGPKDTTEYKKTDNGPYFYNYQNPSGRNFGGYYGVNGSRPGYNQNFTNIYNNITRFNSSHAPGYVPYPGNIGQASNPTGYPYRPYTANYNQSTPVYIRSNYSIPSLRYNPGNYSLPALWYHPGNYNVPTPRYNPSNYSLPLPGYNPSNYSLPLPGYNPGNYSLPVPGYNPSNFSLPSPGYNPDNVTLPGNNPVTETPGYTTSTDTIALSCVICNIPCPAFFKRFGKFCLPKNDEDDY